MQLLKPRKDLKISVFLPCYKRHEYTERCLRALEEAQEYSNTLFYIVDDGSNDGVTAELITSTKLPKGLVIVSPDNKGTRAHLIDFIIWSRFQNVDFMCRVDNDCRVPKNWMNDLLDIFEKSDVQILSPNVVPSNAAYKYGRVVENLPYMPSAIVGGLWFMYANLVKDLIFEDIDVRGIVGAFNILKQIIIENDPIVGWAPNVVVQDMGHWSAAHPDFIRTPEHLEYYEEIGRKVDA